VTTTKRDSIFERALRDHARLSYSGLRRNEKRDADLYSRLEQAGFMLDFGVDGVGPFMKYLRRGSGYYIDVGASELVADGRVKLKSGVNIVKINSKVVVLSDGTELEADLIIYATGYGSMNQWLADLISPEVADRGWQGLGVGL
jgi:putative flavoprotein involved in K+ transport